MASTNTLWQVSWQSQAELAKFIRDHSDMPTEEIEPPDYKCSRTFKTQAGAKRFVERINRTDNAESDADTTIEQLWWSGFHQCWVSEPD
jgi:hypothetical protein